MWQLVVLCLWLTVADAAKSDDLITSLPGLSQMPSYKQYSGYLDASDTKHFHYWFVESQKDPLNDPLVLWLNGGPGCSSMGGFLTENGPLHIITDGKTLHNNPYSWNKIANVLYIESPAGVGYSYDDNNDLDTDDDKVSLLNYNALVDFLKKFPEYSSNPFFVTGESYGGVYLPTLSVRIMEGSFKINFKGMAIGNSLSNYEMNDNSVVFFAYNHGLFGEVLWQALTTYCCNGVATRENCNFHNSSNGNCQDAVEEVSQYIFHVGLNAYALYDRCDSSEQLIYPESYLKSISHLFVKNPKVQELKKYMELFKGKRRHVENPNPSPNAIQCYNDTALKSWLNDADVRSALHIKSDLPPWELCSSAINYTKLYMDMSPQYHQLLKHDDFRILLYNGDTDMVCNFLGDQWFANSLKQTPKRSHAPWYVGGQVAGFARVWNKISFTTIRGAGHLVPQWRPSYSLAMFEKFINNQPFTT
uniref:Carboxypeptidase n=1 Tax=Phallusia mammillata TaxID=59560 RepID=A0A6F9D9G7_9ASCI|nr:lysosomal protective protein-like [Phallusia mammillata]